MSSHIKCLDISKQLYSATLVRFAKKNQTKENYKKSLLNDMSHHYSSQQMGNEVKVAT